jgi:predicted amidohydrolase YtcJ
MRMNLLIITSILMTFFSCSTVKKEADLILTGGIVYTVDKDFSKAEAIVVKDHRIVEVGKTEQILKNYTAKNIHDLNGKFVYPGWIDAHCHFVGYGRSLSAVDVAGTSSVEEIIVMLKEYQQNNKGSWITGRGWDQNDWEVKEFPDRSMLDRHFPDTPILLRRIDGHAAWANTKALEMAGVTSASKVEGGTVVLKKGEPSGIFIDNAIDLVSTKIPAPTEEQIAQALMDAQKNCFQVGLTSVQDAGLPKSGVELIDTKQQSGELKMRINAWLSPSEENYIRFVENGPYRTDHLSVNTIKLFTDGALGSRGALMMEEYSDDHGNHGLLLTPLDKLEDLCRRAYEHNFAIATHCIGDSANRETLKIYADILEGKNDRRWRIEHAQIIHPDDFHYFGEFNIVPSVQSTHATSDMYWADERVGEERLKGAYAYKQLLAENGWIPNGSDFPVEQINPLFGFYASVVRKDQAGYPEGGFQMENAISREEALRAMTIWAAKAGFEEHLKGSIEVGKLADFTITATDLMTAPEAELFKIKVDATYSGGEVVYKR